MSFIRLTVFLLLIIMPIPHIASASDPDPASPLQQTVSDTLDLWREGRYEQLYDHLSRRGKVSREKFVETMKQTTIRPACCWQKIENFQVLNEKRTEATVYAKVGLEGTPQSKDAITREFRLSREGGTWKMHLNDITGLAGGKITQKRHKHKSRKIY